ncbi:MAG TPA: hypothetical protein VMY05_03320 [Acidobacteriota bacterium]|nr:hypothetical protein [Acidobacteriota bacterium]
MERAVCDSFLGYYNEKLGLDFRVSEHQDKPDFLVHCNRTDVTRGLEITIAMFQDSDSLAARQLFGRLNTVMPDGVAASGDRKRAGPYMAKTADLTKHNTGVLAQLVTERIRDKCDKTQGYDRTLPLILVVAIGDKVRGLTSMRRLVAPEVHVPRPNPFRQIWLSVYCSLRDDNGILSLYRQV